jgi:CheY-like chemotaxis protein
MGIVFFADDDPDDQKLVVDAFKEKIMDLEWHFMENGEQLLDSLKFKDRSPDLILLDLNMPVLGGLEALLEIRKNSQFTETPIIVLSTSGLIKDKRLSYEYGTNCFVQKPESFIKLVEITQAISTLWLVPN